MTWCFLLRQQSKTKQRKLRIVLGLPSFLAKIVIICYYLKETLKTTESLASVLKSGGSFNGSLQAKATSVLTVRPISDMASANHATSH